MNADINLYFRLVFASVLLLFLFSNRNCNVLCYFFGYFLLFFLFLVLYLSVPPSSSHLLLSFSHLFWWRAPPPLSFTCVLSTFQSLSTYSKSMHSTFSSLFSVTGIASRNFCVLVFLQSFGGCFLVLACTSDLPAQCGLLACLCNNTLV